MFVINSIPILYKDGKENYFELDENDFKEIRKIWNNLLKDEKYDKIKDILPEAEDI